MSLKEIFAKKSLNKVLPKTSIEEIGSEIESSDLESELKKEKERFIPDIDFSQPSNFAKFGSAEKYYHDSITSIYSTYPYDGSIYEKTNWHNSSADITNYIFENEYPRNNGYINLGFLYGSNVSSISNYSLTNNPEYILFKGGPNESTELTLKDKFSRANKLDYSNNRTYNLYINGETGFTAEFFYKRNDNSGSAKQVIFDLWNSGTVQETTGFPYGRFRIETSPGISGSENLFTVYVISGSDGTGLSGITIGNSLNLSDGTWNHYSFNVINFGTNIKIELYKNGELNSVVTTGSSISEVTGAYIATLGSLVTKHISGSLTSLGYGKLSGSLDEFRFWKQKRTDKDIKRYWFTQIGGGTNTDESNTNLGIYYKFNEGIFDTENISAYDKKIIDYSGRISNGVWNGYVLGSRNSGSAIVEGGYADFEFKDPILYSNHPKVLQLLNNKKLDGKNYDLENNGAMINSFPQWMLDEDSEQLKNISQLAAEYFDDLYLKIKFLPEIQNSSYASGKPIAFASRLLESHGFTTSDIFTDSTILEGLLSRTENINFEEKIYNIKNFIYQNIYNNLNYIYRSKGTEKSIRNLIRCFGVDDNLIKINLYANNTVYNFDERYINTSVKKKLIDFNNTDRFSSTIYQYSTLDRPFSRSYISGNLRNAYHGSTFEIEFIAPKKPEISDPYYFETNFLTASIAGMHTANPFNSANYTWYNSDSAGIQIFLIRDEFESKNAYFKLTSSYLGIDLTSSLIQDIYNEERWNLALKIYHEKYPYSEHIVGGTTGSFKVEFSGYNIISDTISNNFKITGNISQLLGEEYFTDSKRIYAGAHRQNFTGSILQETDLRISSIRYWLSNLSDEVLLEHAKDPTNFGSTNAADNLFNIFNINNIEFDSVNLFDTLALHWDFESVTGSDNGSGIGPSTLSDGKFIVEDLTSGSNNANNWIESITKHEYLGRGDFFLRNDSSVVKRDFISALKRRLPESLNDSDMINILERDDITFTRDSVPVVHHFTIEKSMYQVISDDMIKMFGLMSSFNDLIGSPINRYKMEYRELGRLRDKYFTKVQNDIDIERYIEFFKWFDQSIGEMIQQLIPMSANFSPSLKTMVESHILERNKYWNKYPTLEFRKEPPIDAVNGINELKYNWRTGHAPIPFKEDISCLWWKERAERVGFLNIERKNIFDSTLSALNRKFNTVYDFDSKAITIIDSRPKRTDFIKPIVKFSSNSYLSIEAFEAPIDNDCDDE
jgi:hypothetical protein